MPGVLNDEQIEKMLYNEAVGRIGCQVDGHVFVVPINFGYDGKCVYAHSKEGMKIQMMRKNPDVCFEVDRIDKHGNWSSVIAWGVYEELTTVKAMRQGMKVYARQMARLIPSRKAMPSHGFVKGAGRISDPFKSIVFRIRLTEKTGRYEDKPED